MIKKLNEIEIGSEVMLKIRPNKFYKVIKHWTYFESFDGGDVWGDVKSATRLEDLETGNTFKFPQHYQAVILKDPVIE